MSTALSKPVITPEENVFHLKPHYGKDDHNCNLYTLLDLYKIMKHNNMSHQEILKAVRYGNKLPYLSDTCQKLRKDLGILQTTRNGLKNNLSILQSEISSLIKTKRVLDTDIHCKVSDINNMKNKLAKLESLVN
jgi:hypothetical protein